MKRTLATALLPLLFLAFTVSCNKATEQEPLSVNPTAIQVYSTETQKIETNKPGEAMFTSADDFYATVDGEGVVTGKRIGKTEVRVSFNSDVKTVPVTVLSRYTLYPDLEQYLGASTDKVVADFGEGYEWTRDPEQGKYFWSYENYTKYVLSIGFVTDYSAAETVESIIVAVPTKFLTELTEYLNERYEFVYTQNNQYLFLNHSKTAAIIYQVYSASTLVVTYQAYKAN